jgi:hypothetical protein
VKRERERLRKTEKKGWQRKRIIDWRRLIAI